METLGPFFTSEEDIYQCVWEYNHNEEFYETDCGNGFSTENSESLKKNEFKYCIFCGKLIKETDK